MINVEKTIISQYGTSSVIRQLISNMNEYIDPTADLDNFYDWIWNVDTAQGFGLDVWGRIVDVGRELKIVSFTTLFGFSEGAPDFGAFGEAPFRALSTGVNDVYRLTDTAYRILILTKALTNISATSIPALNQILTNLFAARGKCYVVETGPMEIKYTFEFKLTPVESAVIYQAGALSKPAGVAYTVEQIV